jgi:very-short-patch-repair endonuclease
MAAVLACGEAAVASHDSAAFVLGLWTSYDGPIHITLPSRCNRSRPGIRVHRTHTLEPTDVRQHRGIPVTAPARTLIDLAQGLSPRALQRAIEEAQVRGLVRVSQLRAALDRIPRRRGVAQVRALLDDDLRPALTRSEAERRLLELARAAGLPPTAVNTRVGTYEVDLLWRRQRLVVEVDGYAYHAHRAAFERDRIRSADLQAAGYNVMRVTWRQIDSAPEAVIARLAGALALA